MVGEPVVGILKPRNFNLINVFGSIYTNMYFKIFKA